MNRSHAWMLLAAACGVAVGFIVQNAIPIGVFHDDGQYLILGRSLAEHGTYRFDNLPGAPPGLHYPPGYPAFLALIWRMAPGDVQVLKAANGALLGVAVLAVCWFTRRLFALRAGVAALAGVVIAVSAPFIWLNSLLISETLFVAVLYAAFALDAGRRDAPAGWQLGVGALAGVVALVRSLGDPLGPLFALARARRGRWRDAVLVVGAWSVFVIPWKWWVHAHRAEMPTPLAGAYGEYSAWWRAAIDMHGVQFVWDTLRANVAQLSVTVSIFGWGAFVPLRWMSALLVMAVAGIGLWHARRRAGAGVVVAFSAIYAAVVMVWPYEPDRFLWMLAPVIVGAFALGAGVVASWTRMHGVPVRVTAALCAVVIAAGAGTMSANAFRTRPWEHGLGERGRAGLAATRLVEGLPPQASVATDFDELVHLRTGRLVVPARGLTASEYVHPVPDELLGARLDSLSRTFRVTHIAVADAPTLRAVQWLRQHGSDLAPVAEDTAGAVVFARTSLPTPLPK